MSDGKYDYVHSSHCLEHLIDPREGLPYWLREVRPGAYLIVTFPDEDLYEQGIFPRTFTSTTDGRSRLLNIISEAIKALIFSIRCAILEKTQNLQVRNSYLRCMDLICRAMSKR